MRATWAYVATERKDYDAVESDIHAASEMGNVTCFSRGTHVSIAHMGYLKPPNDNFVTELRAKTDFPLSSGNI